MMRLPPMLLSLALLGCPSTPRGDDDTDDDDTAPVEWDASALPEADDPVRSPLNGSVNYVLDGDTFDIEFAHGGGSDRVRVLAINSPETHASEPQGPDCWALEAQERAEELLPEGTEVWLTFDGEEQDTYGRLLAYVFLGRAPRDVSFQDSFNYTMVREGMAWTYFFDNNRSFEDILRAGEQQAAGEDLGVWNCP